ALGEHVDVLAGGRVEAVTRGERVDLLRDDTTLEAGVDRDLLERGGQRNLDDVRAGRLVTRQVELLERRAGSVGQRHAPTREQTLFDGRLRVTNGVFDAVLALLELDLGRGTDLDDRNTAGELRQALLQLLAVVVRVALLDLGADL